jgi:hypothetical protein
MKSINNLWIIVLLISSIFMQSCKKDKVTNSSPDTFSTKEFTYNKATKQLSPDATINAQLDAPAGIKLIYCYLVRNNTTDSLIYIGTPAEDSRNNYNFSIPTANFSSANLTQVSGIRVMVKHLDNTSFEGFIPIKFFDPDLPQFNSFPTQINADLNEATAIAGNLTSDYGIKQVDIFDDFQTENTYVLAHSINTINGAKQYALNYAYTYRKAAQHIKIRVTDIYNQTNELIINMPVDVAVFKPKFIGFAAKITPITAGTTPLTGNITSVTGLKKIDIYDDRNGVYELVSTLSNLNGVKTYNVNTTYLYKKRASNLKLIAVDTEDLQTELIIPLNVNYGSVVYRDIFMTAQTLGTNTIFLENGTTAGNCNLIANEANIQFVFFAPTAGPTLYNPFSGTTGTFPANMKCNGTGWTIADPAALKDTKFRVLINGASTGQTDVYNLVAANEIDDLSDAFFTSRTLSAPSSSGPRYEASAAPSASLFNLTTAKIIYLRITNRTTTAYKNAIMVIKELNSSAGNSTMKFDIYIQK